MAAPAAHLPDALVGLRPVVAHPVGEAAQVLPEVVADRGAVLVVEVDGVHQLAVDVELELLHRAVADAHRARALVAGEVLEHRLLAHGLAADVVHDLQGPRLVQLAAALGEPLHEVAGLLGEADPHERVDGEGRVADPHVAVVPVADAAEVLGQRAGRRRDHRARGLVGEQLQGQRRAVDGLAPAPAVGAGGQPAPPVLDGAAEELLRLAVGERGARASRCRPAGAARS